MLPYIAISLGGRAIDQAQIGEIATKDPTAILIQMLAILPVHLITLLIGWLVVTNFRRFPFRETLGWKSGGMSWWHHVLVLAGFLGVMVVVGSIMPEQENDLLRIIRSSKWALYTVAFFAVFTAPLVEEVVYRGILYSAFQRSIGTFGAIAMVTFLFAIVHVPQYYPSVSTILLLTLLSLILTLVRVFTGNLLPCIILHTIFNGFQSALLIAEPHLNVPPPTIEPAAWIIGF
ncbi:MAG TPA: CPBP family intramembrane glutamic endopeptidase [Pyrinomonadaceae bacterium]